MTLVETAPPDERSMLRQLWVMAAIGYAAVQELEALLDEQPSLPWDDLDETRKDELIAGVRFIVDHPASTLAAQHDAWRARNAGRLDKDDPRLVKFDELPFSQQLKARIWRHICHAVIG